MITRQFGIPVTSPGAILRRERDLGTPLGLETAETTQHGGLVSDKIIVELIEDWLRLHGGHGFVFDGSLGRCRRPKACRTFSIVIERRSIWRSGSMFRSKRQRPDSEPAAMSGLWLHHQREQRELRRTPDMSLLRWPAR